MEELLAALRAVAEPTRLRLLVLCARGELTVTRADPDPRPEPAARLAPSEAPVRGRPARPLPRGQLGLLPPEPRSAASALAAPARGACVRGRRDRSRSTCSGWARSSASAPTSPAAYFRDNAARWDRIRSLYVDEREVEAALVEIIAAGRAARSARYRHRHRPHARNSRRRGSATRSASTSRARCSAVARVNLERAGLDNGIGAARRHVSAAARRTPRSTPSSSIRCCITPTGRPRRSPRRRGCCGRAASWCVVDFAPHALEFLRDEHAHRRLGFADAEIADWCRAAGLDPAPPRRLPGDPLTVVIWTARRHAAPPSQLVAAALRERGAGGARRAGAPG